MATRKVVQPWHDKLLVEPLAQQRVDDRLNGRVFVPYHNYIYYLDNQRHSHIINHKNQFQLYRELHDDHIDLD